MRKQIHRDVATQAEQMASLKADPIAAACTMMMWDMFKESKRALLAQEGKPDSGDKELLALASSGFIDKESGDD